jgi:hypothetical protein
MLVCCLYRKQHPKVKRCLFTSACCLTLFFTAFLHGFKLSSENGEVSLTSFRAMGLP